LKSPVPTRETLPSLESHAAESTVVPFMRCSTLAPAALLQIRSVFPSALES